MRKPRGNKYDFPTRILSRAQAWIKGLLLTRGIKSSELLSSDLFPAAFNLAQELMLIRLMELNWIIDEGWLSAQTNSESTLSGLWEQLQEWNALLGIELFQPEMSKRLELRASEISGFVKELSQKRFLTAKTPPEIIGSLTEKSGLIHPEQAAFYTPSHLVQMMIEESFKELGWNARLEDKEFMILDPSFGSGNFLLGLLRKMIFIEEEYYAHRPSGLFYPLVRLKDLSRTIEVELKIELARKHLFGLELSEPGRRSALRAMVLVLLRGKKINELAQGLLSFFPKNFPLGDFLLDQPVQQQISLFETHPVNELQVFSFSDKNFPHSLALEKGGFELIIGNPPWLSLKGRQAQHPYSPEVVNYLVERYQADSYRPNLFEMFIRRAIELLKTNGVNCFIVPDRLAENLQFQPLREFMAGNGTILRLHFREPFPGIISDTLIYWLRKQQGTRSGKIFVTDAQGDNVEISASRFIKKGVTISKPVSSQIGSLLEKLRREARGKISDYLDSGVGLIARPGTIHQEKTHPNEQALLKGENVQRWRISGNYYFEYHPRNLIGGTTRFSKLSAPERILVRKTGARLIAALDKSKALVEQSVYFLIPKPGRRMKYVLPYFLALINSDLLNFYYRHALVTNPDSAPQLKKIHLDQLPVKRLNLKDVWEKEIYQELTELVEKISQEQDPDKEKKLTERLNHLVFDLHHLNTKERAMISGKE